MVIGFTQYAQNIKTKLDETMELKNGSKQYTYNLIYEYKGTKKSIEVPTEITNAKYSENREFIVITYWTSFIGKIYFVNSRNNEKVIEEVFISMEPK
jgi:hypothetical protein